MVKILLHCRSKMDVGKSRQKPQIIVFFMLQLFVQRCLYETIVHFAADNFISIRRVEDLDMFFSSSMCLNMTSGINDKCIWKYISLKQDTKANTRKQLVMKTRMTIKQQPKYYIYESAFMVPMRLNRIS